MRTFAFSWRHDQLYWRSIVAPIESPSSVFSRSGISVNEEEVLAFVHTEIGSIGAVELLIFFKTHPNQGWCIEDLVLSLRSSSMEIAQAINRLHGAGFIREQSPGAFKLSRAPRRIWK